MAQAPSSQSPAGGLRAQLGHDRLHGRTSCHGLTETLAGETRKGRQRLACLVNGLSPGPELGVLLALRQALGLSAVEPIEQLVIELLDGIVLLSSGGVQTTSIAVEVDVPPRHFEDDPFHDRVLLSPRPALTVLANSVWMAVISSFAS